MIVPLGAREYRFSIAPYIEFAKVAFSREATYRFEVFTAIGSLLVRVYLFRMVWTALYVHNAGLRALTLEEAITYSTVALLMSLVMDIDQTRLLVEKLEDGSIATDFMKPINVPLYFFSDGTGEVSFHALLMIPSLLLALLIVHIQVPSPLTLAVFFLSFLLGYMVGLLMNFVLNCIAFWTLEIHAVQLIITWITDLLGGEIIPLVFFPAAVQGFIFLLPFAAMYSTPLLIYVGTIGPEEYLQALSLQVFWIAVFAIGAVLMWRFGSRRVVVQGG
ncbi:MAG: ABC-2 family transporter protein [Candidatus Eremiobacteraeota bacterium]|nr:ABC-2 family transporter protein [Candidatus Eremiobacteraeota bacterium]